MPCDKWSLGWAWDEEEDEDKEEEVAPVPSEDGVIIEGRPERTRGPGGEAPT